MRTALDIIVIINWTVWLRDQRGFVHDLPCLWVGERVSRIQVDGARRLLLLLLRIPFYWK